MFAAVGDGLTIDRLLEEVLGAGSRESWERSVDELGPLFLSDLELIGDFHHRVAELRAAGRAGDAGTLERWNRDVMGRREEDRLKTVLLEARSGDELERLLEEHRPAVTPALVESALEESRRLLTGEGPFPPMIAEQMVERILWVAVGVAGFLGDRALAAQCFTMRSRIAVAHGDYEAAARDLDAAAGLFREVGDLFEVGRCVSIIGDTLHERGRDEEALRRYEEAVGLLSEAEDADALLAPTLETMAATYQERGDRDEALSCFERAAGHRLAVGHVERAVPLLCLVVSSRLAAGDRDAAYEPARRLVDLFTPEEGAPPESPIDPEIADLIRRAAAGAVADGLPESGYLTAVRAGWDTAGAAPRYETYLDPAGLQAARRWQRLAEGAQMLAPTEDGEAVVASMDGALAMFEGDAARAAERSGHAFELFERRGEPVEAVGALAVAVQARAQLGQLSAAVDGCERSRALSPDARSRGLWLTVEAGFLLSLGRPRDALDRLNAALETAGDETGGGLDRINEGATFYSLATTYEYLGDLESSIDAFLRSRQVATELDYRSGEATTLLGLGILLGRAREGRFGPLAPERVAALLARVPGGDTAIARAATTDEALAAAAIALIEESAELYREINDERGWTKAESNLANFLPDGEAPRRVQILEELVQRNRRLDDTIGLATTLANLGSGYRKLGRSADAVAALTESLDLSRPAGYFESASASAVDLGRLQAEAGDEAAAEASFREAVRMIESARGALPLADPYRVGFVRDKGRAYEQLVDLLIGRDSAAEAFQVVQQAKSRALLEIAGTTALEPSAPRTGRFGELLADEARCLAGVAGSRLRAGGDPRHDLDRLDALYSEMEAYDPDYVSLRRGLPATPAQLRAWLGAQGRPILLVEYFLTETRLAIFLLREDWEVPELLVEPLTPGELREGYAEFHRQVVEYRNAAGAGWTMLSRFLTEPLRGHLRDEDLVYLVPHRLLHALPLHALPAGDGPLAALNPVVYAPAAGVLPLAQNPSKGTGKLDSCASFGIVFEEEARAVAERFGGEPVGADRLTADSIAELCRGKDVCHFSCHGFFDPVDALSSGLIVADGGQGEHRRSVLTARDVMAMRLRSEVVCLSACESGVSEATEGDELLGLTRAFLYAGASSILASLWSVDAAATRDLMCSFYDHLLDRYAREGTIDKAAALQASQVEMMDRAGPRSSFVWAPFVLTGDWR